MSPSSPYQAAASFTPTPPAFARRRPAQSAWAVRFACGVLGAVAAGLSGASLAEGLRLTPADSRLAPPAPKLIVAAEPDAPDREWTTLADLSG